MKRLAHILLLAGGLLLSVVARGQFYQPGTDPGHFRWYQIETPNYRLLYPQGADSLARTYGRLLEQFRVPVGRSIGPVPGEGLRSKMPVLLHTHNPYSNGMMLWTPRRMELYTVPDPYDPDPVPWEVQLTSHEPRHQAQLQAAGKGWMKPFTWFLGEIWVPVMWDLYMERPFGEGDAVAVETGLSGGTRARTADFLNYYRVALDQGQQRNWYQWRYGSFNRCTPDVYALGYLNMAGARYLSGEAGVAGRMWELSRKNPFLIAPYNWSRLMKEAGVGSKLGDSFQAVLDSFNAVWQADAAARAPFTPMERVTAPERFPLDYSSTLLLDGSLYLLREGFVRTPELVSLQDGKIKPLRTFSHHASSPMADEVRGRLYWSETLPDPRWSFDGSSIIRYYDLHTGLTQDITSAGKRYYNPEPSADGQRVTVVEYPYEGGSAVVILHADNGAVQARYPAPEGVQFVDATWLGKQLFAVGIAPGGSGLYRLENSGRWAVELAPSDQKIPYLVTNGEALEWASDRDGSNQLYNYYPAQKRLVQLTSTRYGGMDFDRDDTYLYYVSQTLDGMALFRTPLDSLQEQEVAFDQVHRYRIEEVLTAQEDSLGGVNREMEVPVSAPRRYNKLAHLMHFHSWVPAYVNADAIMDGSFDLDYENASLGVTAFFQNHLGTLSGQVGYSLHKDPDTDVNWRNGLHAKLSWTGWVPVIEASLDFGHCAARRYGLLHLEDLSAGESGWTSRLSLREAPLLEGAVKAYVPLTFNKGGVLRGLIPQVQYSFSNSIYQQAASFYRIQRYFKGVRAYYSLVGVRDGEPRWLQRFTTSIRGYAMLPTADSQVFPRWGIGAETGFSFRPGLSAVFTPCLYGYAYAYLPGILREQGLRLSVLVQQQLNYENAAIGDQVVNVAPQGFLATVGRQIALAQPSQCKLTATYAVPFSFGDLSLGGVAYIRSFCFKPHADYTCFRDGNLWSAGADLTAELGRLLFVSFDTSIGVTFSYLGGSWYPQSGQNKPWYIGFLFNIDL